MRAEGTTKWSGATTAASAEEAVTQTSQRHGLSSFPKRSQRNGLCWHAPCCDSRVRIRTEVRDDDGERSTQTLKQREREKQKERKRENIYDIKMHTHTKTHAGGVQTCLS